MASTVTLSSITHSEGGKITVNFANGSGREFSSIDDLRAQVSEVDSNVSQTELMCIAYALARSSDLSNIATVKDKPFTFDLSVPNSIKVG